MKPTTDQVMTWAQEAGFYPGELRAGFNLFIGLATLAYAAGAAAMKGRCAKVCEEMQDAVDRHKWPNGYQCAAAIRALGDDDE